MTYATREDLVARFEASEIDDLAPLDGEASRADAALADAASEIDEALAETYSLPLGGAWPSLRAIACDIARARLYDTEAPERVLGRLSSARKRLRRIGEGDLRLVSDAGAEAPRRQTVHYEGCDPVVTRTSLREYLDPTPTHGPR